MVSIVFTVYDKNRIDFFLNYSLKERFFYPRWGKRCFKTIFYTEDRMNELMMSDMLTFREILQSKLVEI